MKVLHVPTNTGGHPQGLARAERALGIDSRAVTLMQTRYAMDVDEVLWPEGTGALASLSRQFSLIRRAVRDHDIIHYNFGRTIAALPLPSTRDMPASERLKRSIYSAYAALLQRYELAAVRRHKRPYFVTYQGDDARQPDYCLENFEVTFYREPGATAARGTSDHVRRQIALLTAEARKVYALNPDLLHVLPAGSEFLPYASVDIDDWRPTWHEATRPLIIHAPSSRWVKGTRYILDAIERLKAEGMTFDFELVEGVTRAEARQRYERAHLLIDQVLAGWYGGLAVELMALGKPVMCYIREEDLAFVPPEMREQLPIIRARPDTVYETLKHWLSSPMADWRERGLAGRRYVEAWHDPLKIARRLEHDYRAAMGAQDPEGGA